MARTKETKKRTSTSPTIFKSKNIFSKKPTSEHPRSIPLKPTKSWKPISNTTRSFVIDLSRKSIPIALKTIPSSKIEELNDIYEDIIDKSNEEISKISAPPSYFTEKTFTYDMLPTNLKKMNAYLLLLESNLQKLQEATEIELASTEATRRKLLDLKKEQQTLRQHRDTLPSILQDLPEESDRELKSLNFCRQHPAVVVDPLTLEFNKELASFRTTINGLLEKQNQKNQPVYALIKKILKLKRQYSL